MSEMRLLTVCLIAILALPASVAAQLKIEAGINQGYEWNIFKNPERIVENSDTLGRNRLWQNSSFNELAADINYNKEWGNSRLRLKTDLSTNLYHQETQAHKYSYSLNASYRSNFADRKYIELSPKYSRKQQDGIEQTDPVFSSRLSYHQIRIPIEVDFYLGNLAWLRFETRYRHRSYDQRNRKKTSYNEYYFEALFKQSVDDIGRFDHEFQIENRTRYRDQKTTDFNDQGSVEDNRFRQFTKVEAEVLYRLQNREGIFEIEFPVVGTLFYDHPSSNLDYREIEFGTEVGVDLGRTEFSAGIERTLRSFENFDVNDSGETLFYAYWTGEAEVYYAITQNINLHAKARYITRTSTRERLTTAFYREYTNSYIQSGITVDLN